MQNVNLWMARILSNYQNEWIYGHMTVASFTWILSKFRVVFLPKKIGLIVQDRQGPLLIFRWSRWNLVKWDVKFVYVRVLWFFFKSKAGGIFISVSLYFWGDGQSTFTELFALNLSALKMEGPRPYDSIYFCRVKVDGLTKLK